MRFVGSGMLGNRLRMAGALVLMAGLLMSGCAYFNTFYHARKAYNEAERKRRDAEEQGRPATDALSLYETSIKKCAKVIVEHPNSKWVDDALLMMGNGFYHREEYSRAVRKYDELISYYPQSPFVSEARWMSGMAEYRQDNLERAREIFRLVAEDPSDRGRAEMARVMLARSWEANAKYQKCIDELAGLIPAVEEESRAADDGEDAAPAKKENVAGAAVLLALGDCYRGSGDLSSAVSMYRLAASRSRDRAERFEAQLRVAEGLRDLGRTDEARQFYEEVMDKEGNPVRLARLRIDMGRLLVREGRVEEGIQEFQRVVDDPLVQELPGEAQFEIGLAYEKGLGDFEEAVKAYEAVAQKRPPREIGEKASKRKDTAARMAALQKTRGTASPDSIPLLDFAIAEQYLFAVGEPEMALDRYRAVIEDGTNEAFTAKSLLAVAWIRREVDGDSLDALGVYEDLLERYPETEYADRAREALGLPPRPKPEPVDTLATVPPGTSVPADSLIAVPPGASAPADSLTAISAGTPVRADSLRLERGVTAGPEDSSGTSRGGADRALPMGPSGVPDSLAVRPRVFPESGVPDSTHVTAPEDTSRKGPVTPVSPGGDTPGPEPWDLPQAPPGEEARGDSSLTAPPVSPSEELPEGPPSGESHGETPPDSL